VRQARAEKLPDGSPMAPWVLRQVAIGLLLCIVGGVIAGVTMLAGTSGKVSVIGCTALVGPGMIVIGRALSPAR
jgi:hypothetical protein